MCAYVCRLLIIADAVIASISIHQFGNSPSISNNYQQIFSAYILTSGLGMIQLYIYVTT